MEPRAVHRQLPSQSRRAFCRDLSLGLAALALREPDRLHARPRWTADPFSLGVAAGDPHAGGFVLWTRLAPEPLAPGGGLAPTPLPVAWEIARDDAFRTVIRRGVAEASPLLGHSVHVEVDGLEPDRVYWYRFMSGDAASEAGRARTAPGGAIERIDFAFASCQNYDAGYYTAYRHMAAEDVRFIVHLGDYIYEHGVVADRVRQHDGPEPRTLEAYRRRYALYKQDADLRAAHAAAAWIVTWDDHEVDNNYAADMPEDDQPRAAFLARRAAAYQAFYEHLPVTGTARPRGPDARLYRRLRFGDLIELSVLDGRQYRSDQPCNDARDAPRCPAVFDQRATMLGPEQERWLEDGLTRSSARWNVLANQVPLSRLDTDPGPGETFRFDRWDGYDAARRRLLHLLSGRARDTVVLTGDVHTNWVGDLPADYDADRSPIVASEFIGTSISSGGDGADMNEFGRRGLAANPYLRFFNGQRGYVRCAVQRDRWFADYRVIAHVSRPDAPVLTRASFTVEHGTGGVQPA